MGLRKSTTSVTDFLDKKPPEDIQGSPPPKDSPVPVAKAPEPVKAKAPVSPQAKPAQSKVELDQNPKRTKSKKTQEPVKPIAQTSDERVVIQIRTNILAPGVSQAHDKIASVENPRTAFLYILKQALNDYTTYLAEGGTIEQADPYAVITDTVQTQRRIPASIFEKAREAYDPVSIRSNGFIANAFVKSAIAYYLAKES